MGKSKQQISYPDLGMYKEVRTRNNAGRKTRTRYYGPNRGFYYLHEYTSGPAQGDFHHPEHYSADYLRVVAIPSRIVEKKGDAFSYYLYERTHDQLIAPAGFATNAFHLGSTRSKLRNEAINGLRAKLRGYAGDYGTFLGELPSGVRDLTNIVKDLIKAYKAIRKKQYRKAIKHLAGRNPKSAKSFRDDAAKAVARGQIAYMWGIAPAVQDAYNLQESVKSALTRKEGILDFEVNETVEISPWDYYDPISVKCGARAVVHVKIQNARLAALAALGLTNPLNVAWNVSRLSFIVDWLLPIGDFLEQLTVGHGVHLWGGYTTTYTKSNATIPAADHWYYTGWTKSGPPPRLSIKSTVMERDVYNGFPPLSFVFTLDNLTRDKLISLVNLVKVLEK